MDMFMDSPVALVGCHALGIDRGGCELDVLVVSDERRPSATVRIGGVSVDLFFASEKDVLKPPDPEHAVSMARAAPVRDASLVLSTSSAACIAILSDSCRKSARKRLASSLKSLGRADEALAEEGASEAALWLLAATYDFAKAWLYSKEVLPAPSHLVGQLRGISKGAPGEFSAVSAGAGLEHASRASCSLRLEALGVLQDALRGRAQGGPWSGPRLEVVESKAEDLGGAQDHVECYSFLGEEAVEALNALSAGRKPKRRKAPRPTSPMDEVLTGEGRLLGDRILRELGLSRDRAQVEASLRGLKEQVSRLSKRL